MALQQGHSTARVGLAPALPSPGVAAQGLEPGLQGKVLGVPAPVLILQCHSSVVFPGCGSPWTRGGHPQQEDVGPGQAGELCSQAQPALICFRLSHHLQQLFIWMCWRCSKG